MRWVVIDLGSGTHTRSYEEVITPYNIEGSVKVMLNLIQISLHNVNLEILS